MKPLVSFVLATCNRRDLLIDVINSILAQKYPNIEIIVISNGSTDGTKSLFTNGGEYNLDCIDFYHYDEQLGVSKARNVGYREATGEILVTLDDDARLVNVDATDNIVSEFETNDNLGIISFKIMNYYTEKVEPSKLPSKNKDRSADEPFECSYFLGGGNAISKDVFETIGYYPSNFEYSFEELDLSYRALDAGFCIKYVPSIVVLHKADPKSQGVNNEILEQYLTNRIRVAVRNLPWRYVIISSFIWLGYITVSARFDPRPVINSLQIILADRSKLMSRRKKIQKGTIKKIQKLDGRLWL